MRALSPNEVLRIWETGTCQHRVDRAFSLLMAAGERRSNLGQLPIGERDRRLWQLREVTFGPNVEALAQCPVCSERIEFQFSVSDVRASQTVAETPEHELQHGDWSLRFRLPESSDLAAIAAERDLARAEAVLTARCLLDVRRNGIDVPPSDVPPETLQALQSRMSELDPQAEVCFALSCPGCGHRWRALFDIAHFFWSELAALARRLLREVDLLARTYGWNELDILALNPVRRQAYLELAAS